MTDSLTIQTTTAQGRVPVTVLHLKGTLSADSTEVFETSAQQAIDAGTLNMLLDFSELKFISSAGLRVLHQVYLLLRNKVQESDSVVLKGVADGSYKAEHLKILNPNKDVLKVLQMTGYDMYMAVFTDFNKAVSAF